MITNNVVLVLGAGASSPYKFPVGIELVREALYPNGITDKLDDHLYKVGVTEEELIYLRKELKDSLPTSLDTFLELRDEFQPLGKKIMAYLLILREDPNVISGEELNSGNLETWYGTLFNIMRSPNSSQFADNKLNIITYNYDRSLEYCLLRALQTNYRLDWNECEKLLFDNIKIIHLHGSLGDLRGKGKDFREYLPETTSVNLRKAASKIRIVHEVDPSDSRFKDAHNVLKEAEYVVFLGFGYNPDNVTRLGPTKHCTEKVQMRGTSRGFSMRGRDHFITSQLPKLSGWHLECQSVSKLFYEQPSIFGKP